MSETVFVLYKNNIQQGFSKSLEEANKWITDCKESYNLDPDYEYSFDFPDDKTMVVHSRYRWFILRYFKYDDTYSFREVPLYV